MEGWWGDSPERKNYKNTRELLQWHGDGMGGLNAGSGVGGRLGRRVESTAIKQA